MGASGGRRLPFVATSGTQAAADFRLLNDVWKVLEEQYLTRPIDRTQAVYGAINGLIASLKDPYTVFLSPEESGEFQNEIRGTFEGIGAEIGIKNDQLVIIAPLPSSPAQRAGLLAGDAILTIDDVESQTLTLDEAVNRIRGSKGTTVKLLTRRADDEPKEISIVRESITVKSVQTQFRDDGIAVIELSYFGPTTTADFRSAANEVVLKNARGIVLDLRSNPGGYLDAAVDVTGHFVETGTTAVIEEDADGTRTPLTTESGGALRGVPTVVLVDQGSASGAEIVAGALQDLKVATLVGVTTFGKGTVQQIEEFADGSSVKYTVARWLTPNGRSINKGGITPDVEVKRTEEDFTAGRDPQLDRALEELKQTIEENQTP